MADAYNNPAYISGLEVAIEELKDESKKVALEVEKLKARYDNLFNLCDKLQNRLYSCQLEADRVAKKPVVSDIFLTNPNP